VHRSSPERVSTRLNRISNVTTVELVLRVCILVEPPKREFGSSNLRVVFLIEQYKYMRRRSFFLPVIITSTCMIEGTHSAD